MPAAFKIRTGKYFYDIFGKGAAFMGTMLMGISTQLSGSSRTGVGMLAVMFLMGFFLFGKTEKINRSAA